MTKREVIITAGAGAASVIVGAIVLAILVLEFGWFDIAAGDAHMPFVRRFVHGVMTHGVAQRAPHVRVPASVPAAVVATGLCEYREHCQTCHGGLGVARDRWASGLNPPPPYLVDARARWSASELYWIISKGVKMTAMPSWKMSMRDDEIWSIVAYLENMPRVPAGAYRGWAIARVCPTTGEVMKAISGSRAPPARELPQLPLGLQRRLISFHSAARK